jgi:hypothetical protein
VHIEQITALAHQRLGIFAVIPRHVIREGDRMIIRRADGSVEESGFMSAEAETSISIDSVPTMTPEQRTAVLYGLAEQMARALSTGLYSSLDQVMRDSGQVVDANGEVFGPEMIFAMLQKIEIEFDQNGGVKNLCITAAPSSERVIKSAFRQIQNTPELLERYELILAMKRERWRDREAARKLVG